MVDESQIYSLLDAQSVATTKGYEEGSGHEFLASQHRRIIEAQTSNDPGTEWQQATENLTRETLKLQMALDSSNLLNEAQRSYAEFAAKSASETGLPDMSTNSATRLAAQQQIALANPEKTAAMAVVEANAPVGTPNEKLSAIAWQEAQLGDLAKSVEGKKWIFSSDSYAADLASLVVNPVRTIFGQGQAGSALLGGKLGYYKLLEQWHKLPQIEQERLWPTVFQRLKDAAGGNDLVLFGLVNPLIYEDEVEGPYVDAAFDVLDSVFTAVSLMTLAKGLKAKLAYRSRALAHGNPEQAGKATVEGIKSGDVDAVSAGHPINGETTGPTQIAMEEDLRRRGRLLDDQDIATKAPGLEEPEEAKFVADSKARIEVAGGKVIDETPTRNGVEFTFSIVKPGLKFTITDLGKTKAALEASLTKATNSLKLAIAGSEPGQSSAEVARLTQEIDLLKDRLGRVDAAIGEGKATMVLEGPPREVVKKVEFYRTTDHVGKINFKDRLIGFYAHYLGTPEARVGKLIDGIVSFGTNMRSQQRRLFGYFDKEVKKLRKGFSKSEGTEVDALLFTGDKAQKVYSDADLRAGVKVDGIGFITFTDKQIAGYRRVRRLFDDLYALVNRMLVDELLFDGYEMFYGKLLDPAGKVLKDIRIFGKTSKISFTPPVHSVLSDRRVAAVLDLRQSSKTQGVPIKVNAITDLDSQLKAKKVGFVTLRKPIVQGDESRYTHAIVDVDIMGRAKAAFKPDVVLEYRKGYVPQLANENIRFIVERPKKITVDGVDVNDTVILRGFESEAEADIFLRQLQAKGKGKGAKVQALDAAWKADPKNKEKVEFIDNSLFRGAFVGHRHENARFKIGLDGREITRVSSFDALQRYADFAASYVPMHEYKQAMIKRFMNSARADEMLTSERWDAPLRKKGKQWRTYKALQDHMKNTFAVPTTEESVFAHMTDTLLSTLESVIYNIPKGKQRAFTGKLKSLHHWMATSRAASDPVSYLKGITFDAMLGAFNPIQYFVQSAGIGIPTSLHPIEALKAMPTFTFLRGGMYFEDYEVAAEAAAKLGFNKRKMYTLLRAWHRSGIPASILENADFGHYAGTHGAYYSPSMFNKIRDNSRMFYNAGEMNNRLFPFIMAFEREAAANGWDLTKPLNDSQIAKVVKEALRLGTNMTAANKAKWQDGVLGLPTQFLQQTHKYYENMFYGLARSEKLSILKENQWTRAESLTALGMNLVLFGAAGLGLDELTGALDRWIVDPEGLGLDPEKDALAISYLRGGWLEMMSLSGLGFELDISDRFAPGSGLFVPYEKIFKPIAESLDGGKWAEAAGKIFFGPSGTTMTRTIEAGKMFVQDMVADARSMEWDLMSLVNALQAVGHVTTTGNNLEKAFAWTAANDILTTRGLPLYIVESGTQIPTSLVVAKALGVDPLAKEKMEILVRNTKDDAKTRQELSRALTDQYRRYFRSGGDFTTLADDMTIESTRRHISLVKDTIKEKLGDQALSEIMAQTIETLDSEMNVSGMDDFRKQLFTARFDATMPSETERKLMNDWIIADKATKIRGIEQDAE